MRWIIREIGWVIIMIVSIAALALMYEIVSADTTIETGSQYPIKQMEATAYCNPTGNKTYSGTRTTEGLTIAGRKEDVGKCAAVWLVGDDGKLGEFLGYYIVQDTGYGSTGEIQRGERVDIYMDSYDACIQFGLRQVYVQLVEGVG